MRRFWLSLSTASVSVVALLVFTHLRFGVCTLIAAGVYVATAVVAAALELYLMPMLRDVWCFLQDQRRERQLVRSIACHPANKRSAA